MPTIADQARGTLKRLLELKLPPTPDNYRRVFESLGAAGDHDNAAPAPEASPAPDWGGALRRLIEEWDRSQNGLSQLQKRQQIDRLASLSAARTLWPELQRLLDRWA